MPTPCTVTGTLNQLTGGLIGQGKVLFQLTNIGTGNPIGVTGTSIIPQLTYSIVTAQNGTFTVSLWGNDNINPANTLYSVSFFDTFGNSMGPVLYSITGASFNLNTAAAVNTITPPVMVNGPAIIGAPTAPQTITGQSLTLTATAPFIVQGSITSCRFENTRYVDPTNICGWGGSDYGAWVMSAIADLPSVAVAGSSYKQGRIILAPGGNLAITQSTTVTVGPFVAIEGPGPQQLILSCTMNADCWQVRDTPFGLTSPFNNNRGSYVGGFTLLGQGSGNANAVGMHVGDLNSGRFDRINIDNFLGANSACFWIDNQLGWFERNDVKLELGAHTQASGETENGCTKLMRLTTSSNTNAPSFNGSRLDVRMSLKASGQIGWSLEPTNPFNFYNSIIVGNANMVAGSILFQISPSTNGAGSGATIDFKAESTGAATGWNTAANPPTPFTFIGPGIVRNRSSLITDSIGANSLVNLSGITQTASVTGCTTGAVQFNTCDSTLTWPEPFLDTNYQVICNGDGFTGTVGVLQGADMNGVKLTTSVNVRTVTLNASAFSFTKITCTGTHQGF